MRRIRDVSLTRYTQGTDIYLRMLCVSFTRDGDIRHQDKIRAILRFCISCGNSRDMHGKCGVERSW